MEKGDKRMMGRRKGKIRFFAGISALLLVAAIGFGTTLAWSSRTAGQDNHMQSRTEAIEVREEFPDRTVGAGMTRTKRVTLQNTGTAAAFVRVSYTEGWETDTARLVGDTQVTKDWTASWGRDWDDGGDGWYYYKKILPAGEGIRILDGVTFPAAVPAEARYTLDFMVETVQASDENGVNADATGALFGRTGTLSGASVTGGAVTAGTVIWD